jgi:hypothetical protein
MVERALMPSSNTVSPFSFIRSDVSRQLQLSRDMVTELREVDEAIDQLEKANAPEQPVKMLRDRRDRLLVIARDLANNATETSSTATTIITEVTAKST